MPRPGGRAEAGRTLNWSNAGHPPPVLVHADGRTEIPAAATPQMMLGVQLENVRTDQTHTLPPGSTLVLYTDGLIEHRDLDLDRGLARLRDALSRHHHLDVDAMLDLVLAETVGDQPDDDVAVLAVRLDAEDA